MSGAVQLGALCIRALRFNLVNSCTVDMRHVQSTRSVAIVPTPQNRLACAYHASIFTVTHYTYMYSLENATGTCDAVNIYHLDMSDGICSTIPPFIYAPAHYRWGPQLSGGGHHMDEFPLHIAYAAWWLLLALAVTWHPSGIST